MSRSDRFNKNFPEEEAFWERIMDMPDIEAVSEYLLRKDQLVLENGMLQGEIIKCRNAVVAAELGAAIAANNALLTRINSELKIVRERMERLSWRNAVKAVFGDEGFLKCCEWLELNRITDEQIRKR